MKGSRKLIDWYFSKRTLPYWCVLAIDCAIILFSFLFVCWAFYRGASLQRNFWSILRVIAVYIFVSIIFFRVFKTYAGILRYSSFADLVRLAMAMGCSFVVSFLLHYLIWELPGRTFAHIAGRVLLFSFGLATVLMWLERILIKFVFDNYFRTDSALRVFIYGIRAGGIGLGKFIRGDKPMKYRLCGYISHDPELHAKGTRLLGVPVFDVDENLPSELKRRKIDAVLVAPGRVERFRNDSVLQDYILKSGAKIYFSQATVEWDKDMISDKPSLSEVKIEDLLPRDEISVDLEALSAEFKDKVVMITGSAGSIGGEIVRQVASFSPGRLILVDSAETPQHDIRLMMAHDFPEVPTVTLVASITNEGRMERIFSEFHPDFVFHAAAYKHVPMMEDNPTESIQNNVYGTKVLADLAVKYRTRKFVMVSTDKAVNPTNVMGCSKRICEIYVQSLDKAEKDGKVDGITQFVTTRFGNVLGSNGSVIPLFEKQIKAGGPVTVTHPDIIRFFMLIPEACKLVIEAAAKGEGGEILVFDMGKPVRIADLAQRMINLSGAKDVKIEYTGLREGEKLYEEVLSDQEFTKPSFHQKIRVAQVREYDYSYVKSKVEEMFAVSREYDDFRTVALMKELVPEYYSKNSPFSVLDENR